jgi:preprotein translocase subunit SecA
LEDPLLRIFASDRVAAIMDRLKMPEGEAIEHPWVTRAIENAQRKVEARNFDIRKQLLEYDDVANDQRKVIYQQRNELLEATDISDTIRSMRDGTVHALASQFIPPGSVEEQWDVPALERILAGELGLRLPLQEWLKQEENLDEEHLRARIVEAANETYEKKFSSVDGQKVRDYERAIMLNFLDSHWREHLSALDHLRQGIHLRGYAQKNPKQEYKREAFELFSLMLDTVRTEVTGQLMLVQIQTAQEVEAVVEKQEHSELRNVQYHQNEDPDEALEKANAEVKVQPYVRGQKIGRNDPCPCGSGKKYKQCHGKLG